MTNSCEGGAGLTRGALNAGGGLTQATTRARAFAAAVPGVGRPAQSAEGVAFNGLLTNRLLTALPGENFARLLPHLTPVWLASGEDVYGLGEAARFAYFPETAIVSHLHVLADGSTTEAALLGREGMTGLSAVFETPPPPCLTHVVVGGSALRINAEVLRQEFGRGGALQRLLLAYAVARLAHVSQRVVCNGRHSAEARTCSWLLMVHDRAGGDDLPLTHEQIARQLGVRRSGVTEIATSLRDKGGVGYRRGVISILDRRPIEAAACECYGVLTGSHAGSR